MISFVASLTPLLWLASGCASGQSAQKPATDAASAALSLAEGPGVYITTSQAVPVHRDVHAACAVDIFFGKGMTPRDVLADSYVGFVQSMNFYSLQYSGGSTADHDHVIVGDTRITGGRGDGYNINADDVKARGEDIRTILDGVGTVRFNKDFFNEYCALLRRLGIRGDVIANVQSGTLEELMWKIEQARARRVIFGMEQNLASNAKVFPDGKAYRQKIEEWISAVKRRYPEVICVIDAAPVFVAKPRAVEWNRQISGMAGDEARLYMWDKDLTIWSDDWTANQKAMDQIFSTTLPGWLQTFAQQFPDKKVAVCQWGLKPKTPLYNTMGACIYIARFYQFLLDYNKRNNNRIGYACYMSLKSLNRGDGVVLNHAAALQQCGKLFEREGQLADLRVNGLAGISGTAVICDQQVMLLLVNVTGSEVQVPVVVRDGKPVTETFEVQSLFAASALSQQVQQQNRRQERISLPPYSVNVVSY
ncbi:MAG: hypothetical protein RMK52_05705 [Chitinophagales bacterium]|nr:hypothetical protein [Chitinophagales bacterium]MDW8393723.1 hypothetical protein [Chitinophagales bacterium]